MNYKHVLLPLMAGAFWLSSSAQPKTSRSFQPSGLSFMENKGQVRDQYQNSRPDIDFKLQAAPGLNLFIGADQLHYQFVRSLYNPKTESLIERLMPTDQEEASREYALYRLDVELIGANPDAKIIREEPLSSYERYFLPWVNTTNDNEGVIARSFMKITYKEVYPNIDWVFYFNAQGQLEHDFVVHPDGNISDIKMQYSGSTELNLQDDGSLQALTPMGKIIENAPYAYTQNGNAVASAFVLEDDVLSFKTDVYSGTLIIDPVIEWGTYFGGTSDEEAGDITTDIWGNVYLCGTTTSVSNIATTGAFQDTLVDNDEAFLSKWNSGGALLWATYYGGDRDDAAKGVAADTIGYVYLFGNAASASGIATAGSYQDAKLGTANRHDAFLVKFDSAGMRQWGTYYGGTFNEANTSGAIAIDRLNNVYITGNTQSSNLPITSNCHQAVQGGGNDGFIAKFSESGSLIWSTYFGGTAPDYIYSIATDTSAAGIYLTGYTQSQNGIATPGAFQSVHAGDQDAFLTMFDSSGQQVWGTYFGGTEIDYARSVALDELKVVISGGTTSLNGIAGLNAHQGTYGGGYQDGFIAAFDLNGQQLWASYYGGSGEDDLQGGVWCDENGSVYAVGSTTSDTGIAMVDGIINSFAGISDVCLVKFAENGSRIWGTYLGGTDVDYEARLTVDDLSNLYVTGKTNSASNISTSIGYQTALGGSFDAFLIRINDCEAPDLSGAIQGGLEVCSGTEQIYTIAPDHLSSEYVWLLPARWIGESDSNSISTLVGDAGGEIKVVAISDCGGVSDTQTISVTVLQSPEPELQEDDLILSTTQTYEGYQWLLNGQDIPGATDPIYLAEEDGYYQVRVMNADNCFGTSDSLLVQGASHIHKLAKQVEVQLYPNPSAGQLSLASQTEGFIQCFNLEGKQIEPFIPFDKGLNRFDLGHLPVGVYLIKIIREGGVKVIKWVRE